MVIAKRVPKYLLKLFPIRKLQLVVELGMIPHAPKEVLGNSLTTTVKRDFSVQENFTEVAGTVNTAGERACAC